MGNKDDAPRESATKYEAGSHTRTGIAREQPPLFSRVPLGTAYKKTGVVLLVARIPGSRRWDVRWGSLSWLRRTTIGKPSDGDKLPHSFPVVSVIQYGVDGVIASPYHYNDDSH